MDPHLGPLLFRLKRDLRAIAAPVKRVFIALLLLLVPMIVYTTDLPEVLEPLALKQWFDRRGARETPQSVSIARLDKPAYDLIGLSTGEMFSRDKLALAMQRITDAGAKVVILDGIPQRPGDDPAADQELARVMRDAPVVIGSFDEEIVDISPSGKRSVRRVPLKPIELFETAADAIMSLAIRLTKGVSREISLSNDRVVHSNKRVPLLGPLRQFVSKDIPAPGSRDYINFYGGPSTIASVSVAEVIKDSPSFDPAYFKDRVVFIGVLSDAGAGIAAGKDSFPISASSQPMYGVEIHATIAANLLDQSYIKRLPLYLEVFILSMVAFVLGYTILATGSVAGTVLTFCIAGLWLLISYQGFVGWQTYIPCVVFLLFVVPSAIALRWAVQVFSKEEESFEPEDAETTNLGLSPETLEHVLVRRFKRNQEQS